MFKKLVTAAVITLGAGALIKFVGSRRSAEA